MHSWRDFGSTKFVAEGQWRFHPKTPSVYARAQSIVVYFDPIIVGSSFLLWTLKMRLSLFMFEERYFELFWINIG